MNHGTSENTSMLAGLLLGITTTHSAHWAGIG